MKKKRKIWLLSIFSILMLIASACGQEKNNSTSADAKESDKTIRIGYQKFGTLNIREKRMKKDFVENS